MLSIEVQINAGKLVCPVTRRKLYREGAYLRTIDTQFEYPLIKGVPVLLPDQERQEEYLTQEGGAMAREYASSDGTSSLKKLLRHLANLGGDYRSKEAREAFSEAVGDQNPDALCLSVGARPGSPEPGEFEYRSFRECRYSWGCTLASLRGSGGGCDILRGGFGAFGIPGASGVGDVSGSSGRWPGVCGDAVSTTVSCVPESLSELYSNRASKAFRARWF